MITKTSEVVLSLWWTINVTPRSACNLHIDMLVYTAQSQLVGVLSAPVSARESQTHSIPCHGELLIRLCTFTLRL